MRVLITVPDDAPSLRAALTLALAFAVRDLQANPRLPKLYRSGVWYAREPALGVDHFAMPSEVARQGWGDCDDLALWAAAALRLKGIRATVDVVRSGERLWHAVVRLPNGQTIDPSKRLGMRGRA